MAQATVEVVKRPISTVEVGLVFWWTHDYPDVMKWHYPIGHHRNEWRNGTTTPSLVAHLHQ